MNIKIDYDRDNLLTEQAKDLLRKFYMRETDKSPQDAFARAAGCFSSNPEHAQRIYDYVSQLWFMFSSPILSNAIYKGEKVRALPISCYLNYVGDSLESLISHSTETRWLSVKGGGVGGHWSDVRAVSKKAPGPIPFIHTIDSDMVAYKQGETRKGSYAAYLDVSHPDIQEFLHIRVPTNGGDVNRICLNIHNAINITDDFMKAVIEGNDWNLIDPDTKKVRETLSARKLWEEILTVRYRTGEPYLNFIDTANRYLPKAQKYLNLRINGSNLCNEIHLATNAERTAVCCLSSLNLSKYDEWKNSTIVEDLIEFLDNVIQFFIDHAKSGFEKAVYSAKRERSLGLGAFGWHSLLQQRRFSFKSKEAYDLNDEVFSLIKERALETSMSLADEHGVYPDFDEFLKINGYDGDYENSDARKNAHLLAIAPNANSASIAGVSPSIEPWRSNAFVHDTRAGVHIVKNPELIKLLQDKDMDNSEVWGSIVENDGSVQQLEFLSTEEKEIFKTSFELDQMDIIKQAGFRQRFICQGQSINLFFPAGEDRAFLNKCHIEAWKYGLKGLYYLRTRKSNKVEQVSKKVERQALNDFKEEKSKPKIECTDDVCVVCEG